MLIKKDGLTNLLNKGVRVVKEENDIIAIYKPNFVLSHPNNRYGNFETLLKCNYNHNGEYYEHNNEKYYLINRLDSATNGLLLMSNNINVAKEIKRSFAARNIHKSYFAKCFVSKHGKGQSREQWTDNLNIENVDGKLRSRIITNIIDKNQYPKAITHVFAERHYDINDRSTIILKLNPLTGYTHQIRVQSAHHGFPIVGDRIYGNFSMNNAYFKSQVTKQKKLYLCACEYRVPYVTVKGANANFHVKIDIDKETFNAVN